MEKCNLGSDTISVLVQKSLQVGEGEDWVDEWVNDCNLEVGGRIRIPYDPDEIARLSETRSSETKVEDESSEENAKESQESSTDPGRTPPPIEPPSEGSTPNLEETMPEEIENVAETTTAQEVQQDPLTEQFSGLTQATGGDPTLTIVLAVLAVVGGGAAWKFYRQHSEQKHEQKMAQMKMDAKAKGMEGQPPGPCQTVHAQLKAEVEELKSRMEKVDKKMSLNADFDGDELERKVRKLEKWRRAMEEDEDE